MPRKNIIVVIDIETLKTDCYGNLKKVCENHGLVYNTIVEKKLPLTKKGLLVQRVAFV